MRVQVRTETSFARLTALLLGAAACGTVDQPVGVGTDVTITATVTAAPVIDLGTLPGGTSSAAQSINNLGQIVGTSNDATLTGALQVIWSGGAITSLTVASNVIGPAIHPAINDSREIASWLNGGRDPTTGFPITTAMYWNSSGTPFVLPSLPGGGLGVRAYDINNAGLIVGESRDATPLDRHAVVWDRTTSIRDLGFMGAGNVLTGNETSARGINDVGDIVGRAMIGSNLTAFLWRNGSFTDLGPGEAVDINNRGLIAGNANPGDAPDPWVWQNGVRTNLSTGTAAGLNNLGDVVGWGPPSVPPPGIFNAYTALLWRGGERIELGNFPGGDLSMAMGINDLGQIVGAGNIVPGGPMHALMWSVGTGNTTPVVTLGGTTSTSIRRSGKVSFKGTFTDPDFGPWRYTFNWGNGTTSGTAASPGTITATRTYSKSGVYLVSLTVTDAKGAAGMSGTIEVRVR